MFLFGSQPVLLTNGCSTICSHAHKVALAQASRLKCRRRTLTEGSKRPYHLSSDRAAIEYLTHSIQLGQYLGNLPTVPQLALTGPYPFPENAGYLWLIAYVFVLMRVRAQCAAARWPCAQEHLLPSLPPPPSFLEKAKHWNKPKAARKCRQGYWQL